MKAKSPKKAAKKTKKSVASNILAGSKIAGGKMSVNAMGKGKKAV